MKATTGGRQGLATAGFNLAAPMINRLTRTRFSDVMENALHNPETAKHLRDFLRSNTQQQAEQAAGGIMNTLKEVGGVVWSARGPLMKHFVGAERYPLNMARSGPAIAADLQEGQPQ
jgi:hypothetical protein